MVGVLVVGEVVGVLVVGEADGVRVGLNVVGFRVVGGLVGIRVGVDVVGFRVGGGVVNCRARSRWGSSTSSALKTEPPPPTTLSPSPSPLRPGGTRDATDARWSRAKKERILEMIIAWVSFTMSNDGGKENLLLRGRARGGAGVLSRTAN